MSDAEAHPLSPRAGLAVLAVVAGALVALEVLFTRVLSVVAWYGMAYLVLSLAMLGLTAGSLQAAKAQREARPLRPWLAARMVGFAGSTLLALCVLASMPMVFSPDLTALGTVSVVALACTLPMVLGGAVVARLMAASAVPLPRLYAVDLCSAALGALAPLALLGPLSGPMALLAVALLVCVAAFFVAPWGRRAGALWTSVALALVMLVSMRTSRGLELRYLKALPRPDAAPQFERWNALSYVRLAPFSLERFPLWSPSPVTPVANHYVASAVIDGEAGTPVYAWEHLDQLNLLRLDGTASAHALRSDGPACVIGVGGGRDLETALVAGHSEVLGIEINPAIAEMLHRVEARSPLLRDPRVRVVVGDGRATLAALHPHCRVLQASLVDTWAATSAGAFAHTEATLYTREAWGLFLRTVEPDGILTFSRWYDPARPSETSRLLSLAVAALLDRGVTAPREHLALLAAGRVATILVSPAPFTEQDRERLADLEQRLQFTAVVTPAREPSVPLLRTILAARSVRELTEAGAPQLLDTSPPTDDRPFFFQLLSPRAWLHPLRALEQAGDSAGVLRGNVNATVELLLTFLAAALVGAALLGPALLRAASRKVPPLPGWRAAVYFGSLGAGFMLAEIALVQRLHVVLGHPTWALVLVLAALLVSTGAGSALSPRALRTRAHVRRAALGVSLWLALLPWLVVGPLARATLDAGFGVRALWCSLVSALVGLPLGFFFPSGVRYVDREQGAPVALAVNGATSVLGGVLATVVSVWFGIGASFLCAGALYALVAACAPTGWRTVEGAAQD